MDDAGGRGRQQGRRSAFELPREGGKTKGVECERKPDLLLTRSKTCLGEAQPTVSAIPTRFTPTLSTALYTERRSTRSERNESSLEKRTSRPLDLTNSMTSIAVCQLVNTTSDIGPIPAGRCEIFHNAPVPDSTHVNDVGHVLSVRVLAQVRRRANDNIETIDTGFYGHAGVVHVAAHVGQDFGLETELADGLAVLSRLLGSGRRCEFDVVDAEVIQSLGNLDLGFGVEKGVGKLLALAKGGLDLREEEASASLGAGVRWRPTEKRIVLASSGTGVGRPGRALLLAGPTH